MTSPQVASVWSSNLERYVCENSGEGATIAQGRQEPAPMISRTFKLIFTWTFVGTLFFIVLCICLSLAVGREPPPLFEKLILATFDLAKIGFGAIVGLLGAKYMDGDPHGSIKTDS
jgi:hypothetical protein